MAFIIPGNQIVVKAILTKAGRNLLSSSIGSGATNFDITKFAVSDDEIDYSIANLEQILTNNPASYPILEPIINGDLMMQTRLYTNEDINSGQVILAQVEIPGLNPQSTITLASSVGNNKTIVTYTPRTLGALVQTYNVSFNFSGGLGVSKIEYSNDVSSLSETNISAQMTIKNVQTFRLTLVQTDVPLKFRMKVEGTRTHASETYYFVISAAKYNANINVESQTQ